MQPCTGFSFHIVEKIFITFKWSHFDVPYGFVLAGSFVHDKVGRQTLSITVKGRGEIMQVLGYVAQIIVPQ
jgi:hypothetical protein